MKYKIFDTSLLQGNDLIYYYGAGHIAHKTAEAIPEISLSGIFDSSENLHGITQLGCDIVSPKVENLKKAGKIIITSTAINEITDFLLSAGVENEKIFISPVLKDRIAIAELEELDATLIFSKGTIPNEFTGRGGGLYQLHLSGGDYNFTKLHNGSVYGIRESSHGFFLMIQIMASINLMAQI